ncbi:MAG: IS6 family transposase [Halobacteriaceae archaeon]
MDEIARLTGGSGALELDFVGRVATTKPAMKLAIRLHLRGLSLSDTVSILECFGVNRVRSTVHNWVQKADLEPADGRDPAKIALDETVVKLEGERYWLFAAVDPETNVILHSGLYSHRNLGATKMFLRELDEKHDLDETEFFVDGAPWLHAGLHELGMHFRHETHGERNPVERVFQEVKRRPEQFYNTFSHASAESVESCLLAWSWTWNQLI